MLTDDVADERADDRADRTSDAEALAHMVRAARSSRALGLVLGAPTVAFFVLDRHCQVQEAPNLEDGPKDARAWACWPDLERALRSTEEVTTIEHLHGICADGISRRTVVAKYRTAYGSLRGWSILSLRASHDAHQQGHK